MELNNASHSHHSKYVLHVIIPWNSICSIQRQQYITSISLNMPLYSYHEEFISFRCFLSISICNVIFLELIIPWHNAGNILSRSIDDK